VENALPQGGWGPFELGRCKQPVYILHGWTHPVDRKSSLVGFVPQEFLPWLSSWCKAPNEELCQQGLRLSFRVNDPEASLGGWEDQGLPFHFCSSIGGFSALDKVLHYSAYLTAHLGIRVPGCRQIPHGSENTWFATRILLASKRRQVLQLMSFLLSVENILSKLASRGRWNPTWIPRYLTPLPFGIH